MTETITVQPAYGRTYNTKQEVIDDWETGVDFYIVNPNMPSYMSIRDINKVTKVWFQHNGIVVCLQ